MKNLLKPDNEAEAIAIHQLLADNQINSIIESFHDTAYDGIYQNQYGWGVIKVEETDYQKAMELVESWRANAPDVTEEYFGDDQN